MCYTDVLYRLKWFNNKVMGVQEAQPNVALHMPGKRMD